MAASDRLVAVDKDNPTLPAVVLSASEATAGEAEAGTSGTKWMTPRRVAATTVRAIPSASAGGRNVYVDSDGVTLGAGVSECVVLGGTTSNPNVVGDDVALAAILGGYDHEIVEGIATTICGGGHHVADATDGHPFIGGGSTQTVHGAYGVAVGGLQNTVHSGPYNTVGGGRLNVVGASADDTKSDATVAGGYQNAASGLHSSIGGGQLNTASGEDSRVGGGRSNQATGVGATVAGGVLCLAAGLRATTVGGNASSASGDYAVAGGNANAASGQFAVALGDTNTASGVGSVALGQRAIASLQGQMAYANGQFAAGGDAQTSVLVAKRQTTNGTPVTLGLAGIAGTGRITIGDNTTWLFEVRLVARRTDADNESAGYAFDGAIDRNSGAATTALVGSVTKAVVAEDTAAWDADVTADATNGALAITVTGEAAKTINWVARVTLVEVTG